MLKNFFSQLYSLIKPVHYQSEPGWWKKSVFYEIFVRSFCDSNHDGIGDLNGITSKLDYLQNLGITAIWLTPVNPSFSYHGYDVTNYYDIHPDLGTLTDFKNLLKQAHRKNIKVIIDLVINHTSSQHPWFLSASSSPSSPYRDWYIFKNVAPKQRGPDKQIVWHKSPDQESYYYGLFYRGMPDLSLTNPATKKEIYKIINFWLKLGVDGFRLDAAKYYIEENSQLENTKSTHKWLKEFRHHYKSVSPNSFVIGEVWDTINNTIPYSQNNLELDMIFNFATAGETLRLLKKNNGQKICQLIATNHHQFTKYKAAYASFLTNHDIDRVMSQVDNDIDLAKIAATIYLTAPGVPFIYYGEEVGMVGSGEDSHKRTPMQWQANSIQNYYQTLIAIRKKYPVFHSSQYEAIKSKKPQLYASLRQSKKTTILTVCNLGVTPIANYLHQLSPPFSNKKCSFKNLLNLSSTSTTLPAKGCVILLLKSTK